MIGRPLYGTTTLDGIGMRGKMRRAGGASDPDEVRVVLGWLRARGPATSEQLNVARHGSLLGLYTTTEILDDAVSRGDALAVGRGPGRIYTAPPRERRT